MIRPVRRACGGPRRIAVRGSGDELASTMRGRPSNPVSDADALGSGGSGVREPISESRVPSTEYRVPRNEYRTPNTEHRVPNTEH